MTPRTKNAQTLTSHTMPDTTTATRTDDKFVQGLGLLDSIMIVAGSMIGSGIFIVSADISRQVGSAGWLLVVWLFTGALTLIGALGYGELAAMMPRAGGQYVYLREALGPLWGFLYGWTLFLVIQTGTIAAVAVAFGKFLGVFFPSVSTTQWLWHSESFSACSGRRSRPRTGSCISGKYPPFTWARWFSATWMWD